ncbi:MAG: YdjY domain-containing protein [Tepidisphaeraceae bacterium]
MRFACLFLTLFCVSRAVAQESPASNNYDAAKAAIAEAFARAKAATAGRQDVLVSDDVIADRKAKTVTLFACATGLGASEPVEFFVAPFNSGKDYESLAVTSAKPSDVDSALRFIGLTPGAPVNFDKNREWPRGPRVVMTFEIAGKPVRAEDMVVQSDHNTPLPHTGLVFTGSYRSNDSQGRSNFAADVVDDKPIAPDYNDPAAVLDLPRRATQSSVYGFQRPAADHPMTRGQLVTIVLTPAQGDAAITSRDISLSTKVGDQRITYTLSSDHTVIAEASDLPHLVDSIATHLDGKTDWFTTVSIDPRMRVVDVRKLYAVLMALEKNPGLKLNPPEGGNLYQRAFFPDESWRNRDTRLGEPWELFLGRDAGELSGRLERVVENDAPAATQPRTLESYNVATPERFAEKANALQSQWTKVIFVYPPGDLTYGELMQWIRPVMATYPRIFVFAPQSALATQPTPAAR